MGDRSSAPDPIYVLRGSTSPLSALTFDLSGHLWSGGQDGQLHSWNMATKRPDSVFNVHHGHSVLWIKFVDTCKMVTQGRDGFVNLWSAQESKWTSTGSIKAIQHGFCAGCVVKTGRDRSLLAVPGRETSQVDIVDVPTQTNVGKCIPENGRGSGMCMAITSTGRENQLFVGYEDGSVALWDIRTFKMVEKVALHTDSVMCMDYNSQIDKGVSGSVDDQLVTFSLCSDNKLTKGHDVQVTNPGFNQVRIRQDGKLVATGGWDSNIRLFGAKRLKPLAVLTYHKESVQALAFSEENILACGSKDKHISLWDVFS